MSLGVGSTEQWVWITGEPFVYTNSAPPYEPGSIYEQFLGMWIATTIDFRPRGTWNDGTETGFLDVGFVVEYGPVPESPSAGLFGVLGVALALACRARLGSATVAGCAGANRGS